MTHKEHIGLCRALAAGGISWRDARLTFPPDGPTQDSLAHGRSVAHSSTERYMLDAAIALWTQRGGPEFGQLARALDERQLRRIAEVLAAMADGTSTELIERLDRDPDASPMVGPPLDWP